MNKLQNDKDDAIKLLALTKDKLIKGLGGVQMSEADKLLNEIGYELQHDDKDEVFYICEEGILGDDFCFTIDFLKKNKLIEVNHIMDANEVKAINKKCEELEWLE